MNKTLLVFLNLSEEVQREDGLMALDLKAGLTGTASELKVLGSNFTKQNILIRRFRHHLGILMGSKEPVSYSLALVFVKTFQM